MKWFLNILMALTALTAHASWRVSLLTCGPGREIYELEGHSALRLVNDTTGADVAVNWGLFDFASPGFVYRFVKGETDYMAGAAPTQLFLEQYRREGRRVTEQTLNLDSAATARIVDLVTENLKPENRTYRYNYVADNCATRPLALIERALDDTLRLGRPEDAIASAGTFRRAMRYYHRDYPWYQFGIDLALGTPVDEQVAMRAMTFSPLALQQMLADATLPDGSPAVTSTLTTVGEAPAQSVAATIVTPVAVGWAVLALTLLVTLYDIRRRRLSRGFDAVLFGVYGLAGCVITFLVFFSVHEPASPNWLLLWLNPLLLLVPALVWSKRGRSLLMWLQMIIFVALIGMCAVWIAGAQAFNSAFIPLIISEGVRSLFSIFSTRCTFTHPHRRHIPGTGRGL